MAMTTYLRNKLLDHVLRATTYSAPTNTYLALFTSPTTSSGGGDEVTGGSYARQEVDFGVADAGRSDATTEAVFTDMPECEVTHAALFDDDTAGNMLVHGPLGTPLSVSVGDDLTIAAEDIAVTMR